MTPLAITRSGSELRSFIPCDVPTIPPEDADIPLTFTQVGIWHEGKILLIYAADRDQWEFPGGGIEPGEHIDDCARREVWEESGQRVRNLRHLGVFKFWLKAYDRCEYGALYSAELDGSLLPFEPNAESSQVVLWNLQDELEGEISAMTHVLVRLVTPA